ncbi:MAG TPA: PKD domain-containing protein, partial [Thermoplasmatales archaeon]|nr:PKD domain-containing protein [Thermoplasmatales archaeon]
LLYGMEQINLTSSDFSIVGGTLSITFSLVSADEVYEELIVTTTFIKVDFTALEEEGFEDFVYLSDIAPNPPLEIIEAYAPNIGSVGETIQFNGSVQPLTGQPPYQYHWDFGDQGTPSTQLNPTHVYTSPGVYTYTFTVTDQAGDSASETGKITISAEGGGSSGPLSDQMILFLAVLVIIIVVGVLIIVWIIRR